MRTFIVSLMVTGSMLVGCRSVPGGGDHSFMGEAHRLENEVMAAVPGIFGNESLRHIAAVVILLLLVVGVWMAVMQRIIPDSPEE